MATIEHLQATEILDSRGNPTVAASVRLASGAVGYAAGKDVFLGLDAASSEFYRAGRYELASEGKSFSSAEFVDYLATLVDRYPIISIEDGLDEGDWDGWVTRSWGQRGSQPRKAPLCEPIVYVKSGQLVVP